MAFGSTCPAPFVLTVSTCAPNLFRRGLPQAGTGDVGSLTGGLGDALVVLSGGANVIRSLGGFSVEFA